MGTFSSSIPGSQRLGFSHFTTSHTHADYSMCFPQSRNVCVFFMLKGYGGYDDHFEIQALEARKGADLFY